MHRVAGVAVRTTAIKWNVRVRVSGAFFQSSRTLLRLPGSEQELYAPSNKEIGFISEVSKYGLAAFNVMSRHFPRAWGFMWALKENTLSSTILRMTECEREEVYRGLVKRDCNWLRNKVGDEESKDVLNGLLALGGENGKRIISEAYKCVGLPPHVTFKGELAFLDLKNKVPMSWIVRDAPAAFNVHPGPPDKRGAGLYVPPLLAGDKEYGVTVHCMTEKVDNGAIIAIKRFEIPQRSTTSSLLDLTARHGLEMFEELLLHIKFTDPLTDINTSCHYQWSGKETTRKMVRRMLRETEKKYGVKGHPVLF